MITTSVALQYKIELYAANLVDGPPNSLTKSSRLKMLRAHQRAWNNINWSRTQEIYLTEAEMSPDLSAWELTGGMLGLAAGRRLRFIQLPSLLRAIPDDEWVIEDVGFALKDFAMDKSQDLLVVIEQPDTTMCVACAVRLFHNLQFSPDFLPVFPFTCGPFQTALLILLQV